MPIHILFKDDWRDIPVKKGKDIMEQIDTKELASFKELLIANTIQIDTICRLLIEKGIITDNELYSRLKEVQTEYNKKVGKQ